MKKSLLLILTFCFTSSLFAQTFASGGINYNITSPTTVEVRYNSGLNGAITIPSSVTHPTTSVTYNVTRIGASAFSRITGITSIVIPNSVTIIDEYAFRGCTSLSTISIPSSVTSIGNYAFTQCSGLLSIAIPNSVTSLGDYVFLECTGLTSVTIPNSVTSIGNFAFTSCTNLTTVVVPNSVSTIGSYLFLDCTRLISVTVGWATPPNIAGLDLFQGVNLGRATLNVKPPGSAAVYSAASVWKNFGTINLVQTPATHLNFDGTNDSVTLPVNIANTLSNGTEMTIEYWFKGTNLQSGVRFQNGGNYIVAGWGLGAGAPSFIVSTDGGTTGVSCGPTATINNDAWHHLAFVWKKNSTFATYLDGVLQNTRVAANVNLPTFSGLTGNIGSLNGTSEFLNGNMDDVRIWNVALSSDDISRRRNCELAGTEAGLLAYYKFNQGFDAQANPTVTTLTDATANGNNATLTNFALAGTTSNWVTGSPVISGSIIPAAPTAIAQSVCANSTVANLVPASSATIKWYNVAIGGTALANAATLTAGAYYAAAVNANGCESARTAVTVTVNPLPTAPTAITPQVYAGSATIANLTATGTNLKWYTTATLGAELASSTNVFEGTTYYVSQTIGTCESTRTAVVVNKISQATQTLCGPATVANLTSNPTGGANANWFTTSSGGTALASTDPISTGTYYVEQTTPLSVATLGSGFNAPYGVAIQADGKIVVADYANRNIKRMNADGSNVQILGSGFSNPIAVAIQPDGKIVVGDIGGRAILRIDADGIGMKTLVSGAIMPFGLAIQADGKIVVADIGTNDIKRMEFDGTGLVTLATGFNMPRGVAIQPDGKILVTDFGNNVVKRMDSDGRNVQVLATGFNGPVGIAIQADGKIVVVDANNNAIKRMDTNGNNIETLASGFNAPYGIATQADGKIVVGSSNNNVIKRITDTSISNRVAVTVTVSNPTAPTAITPQVYAGTATIANLTATGTNLKWYAAETLGSPLATNTTLVNGTTYYVSQTIGTCESRGTAVVAQKISQATQTLCGPVKVANFVSTPTVGASANWFTSSTGGTALTNTDAITTGTYYLEQTTPSSIATLGSGFNEPRGVAVQADGKIVVADTFNRAIKRMNADGTGVIETLGSGFIQSRGVAIQADGKILVADTGTNTIKRMDADGNNIVILGSGFNQPYGVAVQADGKILVADTFNNTIKRMNADGIGMIETLGSGFNMPYGVAIQADGKIIVADTFNYAIKRVNADGTGLVTTVGNGFLVPFGVAIQNNGKIVIADRDNNTIKRIDADGNNIETLSSSFSFPAGVAIQADGKIVFAAGTVIRRLTEANTSNRVAVTVTVNTVNNAVTESLGTLTATETGATYQWYQCPNTLLSGKTNQSLTPTATGDYKVEITKSGCTTTSACVTLTTLKNANFEFKNNFKIYPNPATNIISIDIQNLENANVQVYDSNGRELLSQKLNTSKNTVNIEKFAAGVYMFKVSSNEGSITSKVVKE